MNYDQVIRHFGGTGPDALSRASVKLRIPKTTMHSWKRRGRIPRGVQFELREKSGRRLHVERIARNRG